MLTDLQLHPVYDSADYDLVKDLMAPLLCESIEYWRGVGYFTSGWLRTACQGIQALVENGGSARIVTSPILQQQDWEALQTGDAAKQDDTLKAILRQQVKELSYSLSKDTLNALAWMVADGVLEFKFAIPRKAGQSGDYHDKVGVFIDKQNDVVAIHGSFNDSTKGSLNGEAFSVFRSWDQGQLPYVEQHLKRLQKLWKEGNSQFEVLPIPDAIEKEIVNLRSTERPYKDYDKTKKPSKSLSITGGAKIELRPYQEEAISKWEESNYSGIFEMATGTGKTFTALSAAMDRQSKLERIAVVILVPYLHLLNQWRDNCERFGMYPILCSGNHNKWYVEARSRIQDFKTGVLPNICILAVQHTAAGDKFQSILDELPSDKFLLIVDEVHRLGSRHLKRGLSPNADMRIGLSATPHRWYDEEGTDVLWDYFSDVCFEFSLEQAIGTYLTPYKYTPILTSLTTDEREEYEELSQKIAYLANRDLDNEPEEKERLKKQLLKRANIISKAQNKIPLLIDHLKQKKAEVEDAGEELNNTLVYCAPGTHKEVLANIALLGLRCHEFVYSVTMNQREVVLKQFEKGDIQVLVAIHCLDEGVDIPSTRYAYFLASTSNPKEFVQRRGRILRKDEGKLQAEVYDFLVLPDRENAKYKSETDIGLLKREMPRFAEFASASVNEFQARNVVWDIVNDYEMIHLLHMKPWDIYHEVMEKIEKEAMETEEYSK